MKLTLIINTYNRPDSLLTLLKNIKAESKGYHISLIIIDDCSSLKYASVFNYLKSHFKNRFDFYSTEINYGKRRYWKTTSFAYSCIKDVDADYFFQLPDDVMLVDNFFSKAIAAFDLIDDPNVACLNILNDFSRKGKYFWTKSIPTYVDFKGTSFFKSGWVDMCFIATKSYFKWLDFKIHPVAHAWSNNPELSSGVGKQISERFYKLKKNIYQVKYSLLIHDDHPSVMHPLHRDKVKLLSNHFAFDKITASMATMPGRELALVESVASIIDQVDELHIYLNDIVHYPSFANHPKIKLFFSKNYDGDLGDAGKFYTVDKITGYHFTIDDDIIYPSDYVCLMINAIETNKRKVVVSCHGRSFNHLPVASYYRNHSVAYSCLRRVPTDVFAHVIGTGVLAYHTDTIRIPFSAFEYSNMADIWFSKYCNEQHIPRLILNHQAGWIKLSKKYDEGGSIFTNQSVDDSVQTRVTNAVDWSF